MRTAVLLTTMLVLTLILTACSSVISRRPLGDPIKADMSATFDGVWMAEDDLVYVKGLHEGKLSCASLHWKDGAFNTETFQAQATTLNGLTFLNLQDDKKYFFLRYTLMPNGDISVWTPNVSAFKKAVEDGKLTGTVKSEGKSQTVELDATTDELKKVLTAESLYHFFDADEGGIIHKIAPLK